MPRQPALVIRRMPDGMRPRRELGEQECSDEEEVVQPIHSAILTLMVSPESAACCKPQATHRRR